MLLGIELLAYGCRVFAAYVGLALMINFLVSLGALALFM